MRKWLKDRWFKMEWCPEWTSRFPGFLGLPLGTYCSMKIGCVWFGPLYLSWYL